MYYRINLGEDELPSRHLYLNKDLAPESPLNAAYDINSYYGLANTLSITLGGIDL